MLARTLIVGRAIRAGVVTVAPEDIECLEGEFAEIVVEIPLQEISDAWRLLRTLHSHSAPGAILTVFGTPELLSTLSRLAGFTPFHQDTSAKRQRLRARAVRCDTQPLTCSVIVPCRDEVDNIEPLLDRMPRLGPHTELLFVDGASSDGTPDRIEHVMQAHPDRAIRLLRQEGGLGKADAVFQGFDAATGDVLIILDADMTVAPEDLPRFYLALAEGVARFASGTRFVYGMETGAMPMANRLGNQAFSLIMSWLVDQQLSDTLCGSKALLREDWRRLRDVRSRFGYHDPWGDFDLLLGAAYLKLPLIEVPVPYHARVAGSSKMRAFRDAPTLLRTVGRGAASLKLGALRSTFTES